MVVDVAIVHIGSKLKFTFYSITFSGGGSAPILSGAEVWGPQGVLSRDEHFVLPQGRQLRNPAGWVSGLTKVPALARLLSNHRNVFLGPPDTLPADPKPSPRD